MSEYNNVVVPDNSNELLKEFEELMVTVSKEIIDQTILEDLKLLRSNFKEEMTSFTEQARVIKNITTKVDNILSQSTIIMNSAVDKTTKELSDFLENSTMQLDVKINNIAEDLENVIEENSGVLVDRVKVVMSSFEEIMNDTKSNFETSVDESTNAMASLLDQSSTKLSVNSDEIETKMNEFMKNFSLVIEDNNLKMSDILMTADDKIKMLLLNSKESFSDEIRTIKDYLSNSDKLIRNNQRSITDIQQAIEDKLNGVLVEIIELNEKSSEVINSVHKEISHLVTKLTSEVFALRELNNTINIKVDHHINKSKEEVLKNDKRFKVMLMINGVTVITVISTLVLFLLRG